MKKKALLIGINKYRIPGADLRGCVNDVNNIRQVLTQIYGFPARDIRAITDYAATTKTMRTEIARLVKGAAKGDVLLLHYSGHGSNVPDDDGDEADRRDEILCPTDLDWKDPLVDDWLRTTFNGLKAGVNFTVIMDCCHSGSNTRLFLPPDAKMKDRYLPSPWDLVAEESGRSIKGRIKGKKAKLLEKVRRRSETADVNIPEILISGCRDDQTSADAYISGSYNGALTYHLVKTIRASKGKLSYRELHASTIQMLKKGRYDQVPQLEGRGANFDRQFLAPLV